MASVNDYGKNDIETLALPKLGGTDGWAAAVAAVLDGDDTTVDTRIAALQALVDAADAARVAKAGDTMSGDLHIVGDTTASSKRLLLGPVGNRGSIRYAGRGVGFVLDDGDASGAITDRQGLIVPDPTRDDHAVPKSYVNRIEPAAGGVLVPATNWVAYGGSWGGYPGYVNRVGNLVACQGLMKPTSQQTLTGGISTLLATIPVGYRPSAEMLAVGAMSTTTTSQVPVRIGATTTGNLMVAPQTTVAIPTSGWVGFNLVWATIGA
jgi:hypothetical protein